MTKTTTRSPREQEQSEDAYPHIELPDFDHLVSLAKDDPVAFEALREQLCAQVIDRAPERAKKRLEGIQFTINMERARCRTNVQACMRISEMMRSALLELNATLNIAPIDAEHTEQTKAEVVPLFKQKLHR